MFWEVFLRLCYVKSVSPNAVAKAVGVKSTGTVSAWKKGALPRDGVITALAEYFGVSTDFLLGISPDGYLAGTEQQLEEAEAAYAKETDAKKRDELAHQIDVLRESIEDQQFAMRMSRSKKMLNPPIISEDNVSFPVIGGVAAGYNYIAYEDWTGDSIDIPRSYLHGREPKDYFVLRVEGDSMYPDYQDGDHVLVLRQSTMDRSGQVGVVVYGDENATLKRIEYVPGEDWVKLCPINPQYPPITIRNEALTHCVVLGIAKLVVREVDKQ